MVVVIVLLVSFSLIGLLVVVAIRSAKRGSVAMPALGTLAAELGVPPVNPLVVERHGRSFSVKWLPGGKNTPPFMRLTASVDEANEAPVFGAYRESGRPHLGRRPAIVLRRETGYDRFGKRIGLNREVQTGDAAFDEAVYLETSSPDEDVKSTLADPRLRAAVRSLLAAGINRIELDPKGLTVQRPFPAKLDVAELDRTAVVLAEAAAALPLFGVGQADKPRSPLADALLLVGAFVAGPILLGIGGAKAPIEHGAAIAGLVGGLALWVLCAFVMVALLRGRSDSLRRVVIYGVSTLFLLPSSLYMGLSWANRALDASPAVQHATTITQKWISHGKNSTYYHVAVTPWRAGQEPVTITVDAGLYGQASKGSPVVVTTHAGELGWEWIETFRLVR